VAESAKHITGLTNDIWTLLEGATRSQPASLREFISSENRDQNALTVFMSTSRKDLGGKPIAG
jgi:hypothetical protein